MDNKIIPLDLSTVEDIKNKIYLIRNEKVMLDFDLAALYQVKTKALNQAVKRNLQRFPADFMLKLNKEEENLISQIVISAKDSGHNPKSQTVTSGYGGRTKRVFAFTERHLTNN